MTPLPLPRDRLAGCVWLPRIAGKIRAMAAGELPPEYAARFCDRDSIDEHFLNFFAMEKAELMAAVERTGNDDAALKGWFVTRPGVDAQRISDWNEFAETLGRPGHPMAQRFIDVLPRMYAHLDPTSVHSIFDLLEADETDAAK